MKAPEAKETLKTWKLDALMMRYQWGPFLIHSIFALILQAQQLAPGLIIKAIFDRLTGQDLPPGDGQILGIPSVLWLIILYLVIEIARLFAAIGFEWFGMTYRLLNEVLLGSNLFASILRRRSDQPLPVSSGEALNRFRHDEDLGEVTDFPTWIPDQVGKYIAAAVAVILMARINLAITLVIFLPLIGIFFITRLSAARKLVYFREGAEATDAATGFLGEAFGAVQAIKVAGAEGDVVTYLNRLNARRKQIDLSLALLFGLYDMLNNSVVNFGIGIVLLMAGTAIHQGVFSVGDFALFVSYLWFTTRVPSELGSFYSDYQTQAVSIERLLELIRPQPASTLIEFHPVYGRGLLPEVPLPVKVPADRLETLEVRGLSYHFPTLEGGPDEGGGAEKSGGAAPESGMNGSLIANGSWHGIEDISFRLERGSFLAVTGRIGSGKSTLVRALLGLITPQSGETRWNGQTVADPTATFRPPRCAYISQVPRLFSETLRENILLGLPEDQVDLPGAIHLSVLEPDIAAMESGLDTLVGPRGVRLSGGQVQRAAAARLHVRTPELLVFDDLSSALDVETERQLWERLDERRRSLGGGLTCLVITHRRAVLRKADWVLVLKDGRLEAEGRLAELLDRSEEMQKLWKGEVEQE
jgi:ATP-binding cassette subfamily B protein